MDNVLSRACPHGTLLRRCDGDSPSSESGEGSLRREGGGGYDVEIDLGGGGRRTTLIMVAIGVLWAAIAIMGSTGLWFPALLLSILLMSLLMMLGCAHAGKLSVRLLLYPILPWAVIWAVSFGLAYYYGVLYSGRAPDFTILGMHPSFAWIFIGYWLGGVATLTVGFVLRQEDWLSEARWKEFTEKIARLNEREEATDE